MAIAHHHIHMNAVHLPASVGKYKFRLPEEISVVDRTRLQSIAVDRSRYHWHRQGSKREDQP